MARIGGKGMNIIKKIYRTIIAITLFPFALLFDCLDKVFDILSRRCQKICDWIYVIIIGQ